MTGSRSITSDTLAAAQASTIHPLLLIKLEFDEGDVNFHSELGDIVFSGDTYTGAGRLGSISTADEVSDLSNSTITLSLSNIPGDLGAILLGSTQQFLAVTISSEINVLVLGIMLVLFVVVAPKGIIGLLRPRYRLRAGGKHDK